MYEPHLPLIVYVGVSPETQNGPSHTSNLVWISRLMVKYTHICQEDIKIYYFHNEDFWVEQRIPKQVQRYFKMMEE